MQFGKSLVGALLGAAVGIAMLVAVYLTTGHDWVWLVVPFAILTGIGVRMLVSKAGQVSYARGALTMLVAIGAYVGGWTIVAGALTAKANATGKIPVVATGPSEGGAAATADDGAATDESKTDENKDETATDEQKKAEDKPKPAPKSRPKADTQSTGGNSAAPLGRTATYGAADIICLAVAALIAYQLGRGSGNATPAASTTAPAPGGMHPDA